MLKIAKVVNGTVTRMLDSIPENLEDTSNFRALSSEEMAARNWFPVTEVKPPLSPYESYGNPTVEILPTEVIYTYPVVPADLAIVKQQQRQFFRNQLKKKIYETYDVDDYVAMIVLQAVPAALKTRMQNLKTAYDAVSDAVNAATTVAEVLAVNADWPA